MKVFNYLLFRIYRFYTDRRIEKDIPLFYTSLVVTVLLWINIFSIYGILCYYNKLKMFSNKYYVFIPMLGIWSVVYFFFVRSKKFLDYDFRKDVKGGIGILAYITLTAITFIIAANLYRSKIAKESSMNAGKTEMKKNERPSLEGDIRRWFEKDS